MALTAPSISTYNDILYVSVGSTNESFGVAFQLNPTLIASWSDSDLTNNINTLKNALELFCVSGDDMQVNVTWGSGGSQTIINTYDTV